MGLKINIEAAGLDNINKILSIVDISSSLPNNSSFNSYIKNKVISIYEEIMNRELGGTTNDEEISLYKSSYGVRDINNGFILYNNATIPQSSVNTKNKQSYPKGFSIAMAFEYGVGIVGIGTGDSNAWDYDKHGYGTTGWNYTDSNGREINTTGYLGLQIFRKTKARVEEQLPNVIKEYMKMNIKE